MNVFFQGENLSCEEYATALASLLNFEGKFDLCLDRTNWKFGQKHINYLVLSWRISKDLSMPLLFVDLDKAGNSSTQERLDLLDRFCALFGVDRIQSLMADREFVGKKWFETLNQKGVPFFIHIKGNTQTPYGKGDLAAKEYFEHLNPGQARLIEKEMYGKTVYFAGTRKDEKDLVIAMTNQDLSSADILKKYKERGSIEELFKKLKSSGFNWENTHMKDSGRLVTLLIILGLATLIAYLAGTQSKIPYKKTVRCYLKTVFRHGLIILKHQLVNSFAKTIQWIKKLLNTAHQIIFNKSDG